MRNDNYAVSVVVPMYNSEFYISKCLESIISQSYSNMQIILVNDGSTDDTRAICEKYAQKDQRILLINKENEGLLSARLTGTERAEARYIAFVDSDDWIEPLFIENMMNKIEDADIICSDALRIYEDGHALLEKNSIEIGIGIYDSESERRYLYERMLSLDDDNKLKILPYAWNKLFKKKILLPILRTVDKRIFDGEDVAFVFPYLLKAKKIVVSDYCGYNYFFRNDSLSNKKRNVEYYNESCLYVWLYEIFNMSEYRQLLIPQLNKYMLMMVWKRSPALYISANKFVFPYHKVKQGSIVIIYGDGDVGGAYHQQLSQNKYCVVAAIADKKYKEQSKDLRIAPEKILSIRHDYVVIAVLDKNIQRKIKDDLLHIGVDEKKIVS